MNEEFPYELLFKFVFPDWRGPIPPLPNKDQSFQQRSFLSSDSDEMVEFHDENLIHKEVHDEEENFEIEGYVIWEIQSESLSNLINERPKKCTAENITKVIIHTQESKSISLNETTNIHFSENCIHFLPNSSWVFSIDPEFQSSIVFFDPIIALWLQNTECLEKSENLVPISFFDKSFSNTNSNDLNEIIFHLFEIFISLYESISSQPQLLDWLNNIEIPHVKLMGKMHQTSLYVDTFKMEREKARLSEILYHLEKEIYSIAGCEFNILSPFDVSDIMFNHLHVTPPDSNPQNAFSIDSRHRVTVHREFASTNSLILEKISHPIARKILEYRKIQKIISNWLSFTDFCDEDGALHPTFLVCSTATGRISTKSPNLQNIPCQDKRGNSPANSQDPLSNTNIRSLFIPCPIQEPIISLSDTSSIEIQSDLMAKCQNSEYILLSLDYSQLELRILAHFSQDASLCDLCSQPEIDLHSHIAKIIFGVDSIDQITSKQREEIKQAVYATIYGKGWTKDGVEKGQKLESVLKTFPGIRTFVTNATAQATKDEFIETLSGKKRLLPNIKSSNAIERKRDQRMAINTKIQGSAADFVKFALLQIMNECGDLIEPLLQLHDEWLFRTRLKPGTKEFDDLCQLLKSSAECSEKIGLNVPIPCKIAYGPSYGELIPI